MDTTPSAKCMIDRITKKQRWYYYLTKEQSDAHGYEQTGLFNIAQIITSQQRASLERYVEQVRSLLKVVFHHGASAGDGM